MNRVVRFLLFSLLLAVIGRVESAEDSGIRRSVDLNGVVLESYLSETNLLAGGTAILQLELSAPAQLKVEFKKLAFDAFLVFGEEHPAYTLTEGGRLIYRHEYYLQARKPGLVEIPEIRVRFTDVLKKTDAQALVLPALPVTVRGLDVKKDATLQWSESVEVTL